jgi:hypothetical protein
MDDWSRPNPFDPRLHGSGSSRSLRTVNHGQQGEYRQDTPYPLGSAPSVRSSPLPPPAFLPNQPALWQLGRHSWYISGDERFPRFSDAYEGRAAEFFPRQIQDELADASKPQLRDVEEELHRGLKARQVSRPSIHNEKSDASNSFPRYR